MHQARIFTSSAYNGVLGRPVYQNVTQFSSLFNTFVSETRRRWKYRPTRYTPPALQADIDGIRELGAMLQTHLHAYGHVEGSVTDAFTTSLAKIRRLLRRIPERHEPQQYPQPQVYPHAPQDFRMDPSLSRRNLETHGTSAWADEALSSPRAHEYTNREISLEDANEPLETPFGEVETFVPSSSERVWT